MQPKDPFNFSVEVSMKALAPFFTVDVENLDLNGLNYFLKVMYFKRGTNNIVIENIEICVMFVFCFCSPIVVM